MLYTNARKLIVAIDLLWFNLSYINYVLKVSDSYPKDTGLGHENLAKFALLSCLTPVSGLKKPQSFNNHSEVEVRLCIRK